MKPRPFFWTIQRGSVQALGLVAVLLVVSCAPVASTLESAPVAASAIPAAEVQTLTPTANVPTVLPVATSRGPNLEATDPTTVQLANGGIQLVEFFRFT